MNILTFDVEDWFHILDHAETSDPISWDALQSRVVTNTLNLLEMLSQKNQSATFFCLGWIAEKYPSLIVEIINAGHELGSHSYAHQLIYRQTKKEFKDDLIKSISILEDISGTKITSYRAPGFSVTSETPWVFDVLVEAGITHDCSIFPISRAHGGLIGAPSEPFILESAGGEIKAFPMNTYRILGKDLVFSGGGYFRLLNYGFINYMMKKSSYVMTYFHPRDFDPLQPIIQGLGIGRQFKSYIGINGAFNKLGKLIDEHHFLDLRTAASTISYSGMKKLTMFPVIG